MKPRILVGMATLEYMLTDAAFSLTAVMMHATRAGLNCMIANGKSNSLANSLMGFVRTARSIDASHIMLMEHDHSWPEDVIPRLLAHDQPIAGATYAARMPPHRLFGVELDGERTIDLNDQTPRAVKRLPLGALLIRTSVFDGWEEPLFSDPWQPDRGYFGTCDYAFCDRARASGATIWLDPALSLEMTHIAQVHVPTRAGLVANPSKLEAV